MAVVGHPFHVITLLVKELLAEIHPDDRIPIGKALDDRIDLLVVDALGVLRTAAKRKDRKQQHLRLRLFLRDHVKHLAKEYSRVYALVVVAGMEYAGEVEALESKDVLASTKIWATSIVEQRVKTAIDSAANEINKWKI